MAKYHYREVIRHDGLGKAKTVSGKTPFELKEKIKAQRAIWDQQWARKQEQEAKRLARELADRRAKECSAIAERRTAEAEAYFEAINSVLSQSIQVSELAFDDLRDHTRFSEPEPEEVRYLPLPVKPDFDDEKYHPPMPLLTSFTAKQRSDFEANQWANYERDCRIWETTSHYVEKMNDSMRQRHGEALSKWGSRRKTHLERQHKANAEIDDFENGFRLRNPDAVRSFYELVIDAIELPISYQRKVRVDYDYFSRVLIVEYRMPTIDCLPTLKRVRYVKTHDEFRETYQPQAFLRKTYESFLYQLVLRVIRCVSMINDTYGNVSTVVFNGWVRVIESATGNDRDACILSVGTSMNDFHAVNLAAVDPKEWFKSMRGVSAKVLANMTPIRPIATVHNSMA